MTCPVPSHFGHRTGSVPRLAAGPTHLGAGSGRGASLGLSPPPAPPSSGLKPALAPRHAELVVSGPLLGVPQHLVSFTDFFESLFRCFILRVGVRMIFL